MYHYLVEREAREENRKVRAPTDKVCCAINTYDEHGRLLISGSISLLDGDNLHNKESDEEQSLSTYVI